MKPKTPNQNRLALVGTIAALLFATAAPNVSAHDTDIYFTDPAASGLKPNVVLVLDTSGSMETQVGTTGMMRLDHMKEAMKTIVDESANINIGVMRFSSDEGAAVIYPVKDIDATTTDDGNLIAAMLHQSDDAEETVSTGAVTTTSTDLDFASDNTSGVRFKNVYIPRGATITSARLTFVSNAISTGNAVFAISADDSDDAPTYSAATNDITSRAQTAAVAWNVTSNWSSGTRYYTDDITSVVSTVVNRAGWCSGNAMAFTITRTSGTRSAYSYDAYSERSPKLVVTYTPPATGTTANCNRTVVARVKLGSDDAEQRKSNGNMTTAQTSSNPIQLTKQSTNDQYVGVRFQDINVPNGATIVSADIEFRIRSTGSSAADLRVYGELSPNPLTFSSTNNDIWSRPRTSAVDWNSVPAPAVGAALKTPDLTSIVQQIVNQGSWAPGNAMAFVIEAQAGNQGPRNVEAYETSPAKAPYLRIIYQSTTSTTRLVRDELKEAIVAMTSTSATPIVDALYEAALYLRGGAVDYGKVRENANTSERYIRVSHPDSYTGGTLSQPAGCTNADIEADACKDETITGSPVYTSPVTAGCQSNHIVLLTDGAATANQSQAKVRTLAGVSSCSGSGDEACGVTLTSFLANNDQFTAYAGIQPIITHTIGFNFSAQFLQDLATNGKGTYTEASDADAVVAAFQAILNQVLSDPTGFVSPSLTVNAFNRLYNQDDIFFSLFSPQMSVGWPGNVKKYRLCDFNESCTSGEIMDVNNASAVDPTTSKIKNTAQSYWSAAADGPVVDEGGAGANIPAAASRNVYTYTGAADVPASPVALNATAHLVQDSNTAITKTMLGNAGMSDALRTDIIKWMRGHDVRDENSNCPTGALSTNSCYTENRWPFADALHSRPVTVTYGGTAANPVTKLFVGTNDGGLRMINTANGTEEWIVYLPERLNDMEKLMDNNNAEHIIGVDGAPTVWIVDNDKDGIIEPASPNFDKVYLFTGMRRGGRDIYAFDVTPGSVLSSPTATGGIVPKFLWRIKGGVAGDYAGLGQTWSTPKLATIRVKCTTGDPTCDDSNAGTLDSKKKTVLIFGGGYDPGTDHVFPTGADAMGNGVYIVDPLDGSLVWRAGGTGSGAPKIVPEMKYAIPSDVAMLDSNGDGAVDRLYVGDSRGQIFRIDLSDQIDPSGSTAALKNGTFTGSPGSSGYVFADVGCTGGVRSNDCSATAKSNLRKFFYPPSLVQVRDTTYSTSPDYDLVAIASGDREDPLDKMTQPLSIDPVRNRLYAFRDYQYQYGPPASTATLTDSDLYNSTSNALEDPTGSGYAAALAAIQAADGWLVDLKETSSWIGEKGLAEVTVFGGILYATTYVPPSTAPIVAGTCPPPAEGTGYLYGLNYLSGAGAIDLDNADGDTDRRISLGGGIPSGVVVIIREDGTNAVVGTSGGAKTGGKGPNQFGIDDAVPREPTFWYDE